MSGNQWKSCDETRSVTASDTTDAHSASHVLSRWGNSTQSAREKKVRKDEKSSDEFGEQLVRILNERPEFQGTRIPESADDDAHCCRPLFSRRNFQRLWQSLSFRSIFYFPVVLLTNFYDTCCFLTRNRQSLRSALLFFLSFLLLSLSLVVFVCHKLVVWTLQTFIICIRFLISMFIDVQELQSICPDCLLWMGGKVVMIAKTVDHWVLLGRWHAAREWNDNGHVWNFETDTASRTELLWKCPPPSVRLGRRKCLDANRLPNEWSNDTKKHVLGINYCFVLLRADHVRRQQKYEQMIKEKQVESTARRAAFARARSQHMETPSLKTRGLIAKDQEDSSGSLDVNIPKFPRSSSTLVEMRRGTKIRTASVQGELESVEIVGGSSQTLRRAFSQGAELSDSDSDSDVGGSNLSTASGISLDDLSLTVSPRRTRPSLSREYSGRSDESDVDMDWLDVGTKIGLRILNSEHVQKAVASQETAERIYDISKKVESQLKKNSIDGRASETNKKDRPEIARERVGRSKGEVVKPLHTMWTSPASAARQQSESSLGSNSSEDDDPLERSFPSPERLSLTTRMLSPRDSLPPRSPQPRLGLKQSLAGMSESESAALPEGAMVVAPNKSRKVARRLHAQRSVSLLHSSPSPLSPKTSKKIVRRPNLQPGTKVVVPMIPRQPGAKMSHSKTQESMYQMATVVKSRRIHLKTDGPRQQSGAKYTNCLSITVKLDKSFLRGADFAEMTFRVRDEWSSRYMPRHSKFPIGACVATSFGIGVLVGWRVEDDIHVIGSLWQHRGAGSAHAYLRRDAIHGVIEGSIGFDVETNLGRGSIVAYVNAGRDFRRGRFFVHLKEGRSKDQVLEFARSNILSCLGAKYIPVIELLREAAQYQLLLDSYKATLRQQNTGDEEQLSEEEILLRTFSKGLELLWESFLKAIEEDKEFDEGFGKFVTAIIGFLEGLDGNEEKPPKSLDGSSETQHYARSTHSKQLEDDGISDSVTEASTSIDPSTIEKTPGFFFINDWFGGIFQDSQTVAPSVAITDVSSNGSYIDDVEAAKSDEYYRQAFAIVRTLMRTVSIARASCYKEANLRLALSVCFEFLLFVNTILKVQQRNVTQHSLQLWKRTLEEVSDTFGPIKDRLEKIGKGLAERIEHHGKKAKVRVLRFADAMLSDEALMIALERDDWETCIDRVEEALVKSKLLDEASRAHIHKTIMFIYKNTKSSNVDADAAARHYGKHLAVLASITQRISHPRRAFLTMLQSDTVLDLAERLLVRVFRNDSIASRMLTIHASNFKSLRQLRMLKDFSVVGQLWLPILDAANDELHWVVSNMPEKARELMVPLSQLFSLCVSQFHKLGEGDMTADWLKFLMEDDAVALINEIDTKLILSVEALCKDIKKVMVVLPYYPSIDDDILNLIDEVDLEEFLKEAADAIEDVDRLTGFVREKATIAIERFLDWLPKMSIPVDRRELGDGWVLTCRGESGGDLTLSDVTIKRENLCCQVLGGETMFFPMLEHESNTSDNESLVSGISSSAIHDAKEGSVVETSILDHIRDVLEKAQQEGYWVEGVGGVEKPPTDRYVAFVLGGLPVTAVLNTSIELWRSLEIDDDELLEIVIREVSYQIKWHEEHPHDASLSPERTKSPASLSRNGRGSRVASPSFFSSRGSLHRRFNPRADPTVLYFEMKKLSLTLERFHFRIEKMKRLTIFDPVFEGQGTVHVRNISMRVRVECRKEKVSNKFGSDSTIPILHLQELDVGLEKVKFKVKETGADWILNQAVKGFEEHITKAVEDNLKEQVKEQIRVALEGLNSYFVVNPELLLGLLGITMDDLDEKVVWV